MFVVFALLLLMVGGLVASFASQRCIDLLQLPDQPLFVRSIPTVSEPDCQFLSGGSQINNPNHQTHYAKAEKRYIDGPLQRQPVKILGQNDERFDQEVECKQHRVDNDVPHQ